MRAIHLHDTASGELRELICRQTGRVGIYACGPTVYDRIHVGNARPFVVFSLLKRFLTGEGFDVTLVVNITDVNDKIYDAARPQGVGSQVLADEMAAHYRADTDGLGLGRPDHEPLASASIEGIVELIAALLERDAAYLTGAGDVWFRVRADPGYGALSNRELDAMDQGEGLEGVADKEDPLDFALWKAQKTGEDTAWDAPWGRGRPGWHIECSAMAEGLLGTDFEIHGGGNDLVFPHHENEAAQTRAARGVPLARIWMHNGMLQVADRDGTEGKMAKSIGNVARLEAVVDEHGRDALLMLLVSAHYRQPVQFSERSLAQAAANVRTLRELAVVPGASPAWSAGPRERFFAALAEDFNTPKALAEIWSWVRSARADPGPVGADDLEAMLDVLGLANLLEGHGAAPPELMEIAREREAARAAKDWARADELRDRLAAAGWTVRDGADGPELVPA